MKKLTRTLALLLCAVMMFSVFAACEETGTTSENESVSAAESGNAESSFDDEKAEDEAAQGSEADVIGADEAADEEEDTGSAAEGDDDADQEDGE